jgi:8-amino-7-oxononanoate synthase
MTSFSSSFSSSPLGVALVAALASREARSIRRQLPSPNAASLADFTSNDYLSLSSSPLLRSHFLQRLSDAAYILGSGGSRLLVNGRAHAQLENRLKNFFGSEEALLFNSGFDANTAFFECIPQPGDVVVYDEHVHASVHDGLRSSRIRSGDRLRFRHNDVADLKRVLKGVRERPLVCGSVFVAVESVYSMDGTVLPLREVCDAVEGANGWLVVDEAHATGLYGPQGKGRVAMAGLEHRVLARLCTFGKALGASGGESDSPRQLRDVLTRLCMQRFY